MADIVWPGDLKPYRVMFYLQPHVGGSESPLTRVRKTYGLSAPRWIARLSFRGGYSGAPRRGEAAGFGPRLDAMIADLEGGLNLAVFHDFRRRLPLQPQFRASPLAISAASKGDTTLSISGFVPNTVAYSIGDYIGGVDDRPHIVRGGELTAGAGSILADAEGVAVVSIKPPLAQDVAAGTPPGLGTGRFQLVSPDAGENETTVGQSVEYVLDFVEDLN